MFTMDTVIDSVQTGKKEFVKTFVRQEDMADVMNRYIDIQTDYAKDATKLATESMAIVGKQAQQAFETFAKFDFIKFGNDMTKAFQTATAKSK